MSRTVTFPPGKISSTIETFLDEEWYLATYLYDEDETCTLFVRRFIVRRGTTGRVWCRIENTVREYQTVAGMLNDIAAKRMKELPAEADGDLDFVPDEIRELVDNLRTLR